MRPPTPTELEAVLDDLRRGGVALDGGRIIHNGSSLVIGDGNLVARIAPDDAAGAEEVIGRAYALGAQRAPVLEPAVARPIPTRMGEASIWPQGRAAPDPVRNLGRALAALHAVEGSVPPARSIPRDDLRRRLRRLSGLGVPETILGSIMRIASELPELPSWHDTCETPRIIHGDAHAGNIVWLEGRNLLLDIGGTSMGHVLLDLVPVWCEARRGGRGWGVWNELRDGYGDGANDLATWQHLEEAVLERELLTTIFLAERWIEQPWVRDEIELRVRSWAEPETGERWNTGG